MFNRSARFTVACKRCAMRLAVDRIRDAEAAAMADHLRTRHPWLCLPDSAALGEVFEHFRVMPMDPDDAPPEAA